MDTPQNLFDLVTAAQADAKVSETHINVLQAQMTDQNASSKNLDAAISERALAAIDIYTTFEARMQHHFKRGPFSRKLKALLMNAGHADLAERVHNFYLAINVLKHGKGASYRELLNVSHPLIVVIPLDTTPGEETPAPSGMIDVTVPGFFDGLTQTILDAYEFLETQ